jgi:hypothetical protein
LRLLVGDCVNKDIHIRSSAALWRGIKTTFRRVGDVFAGGKADSAESRGGNEPASPARRMRFYLGVDEDRHRGVIGAYVH